MNSREGACLSAAYDDMMGMFNHGAEQGEIVVVHGWVYSHKLNASIKHAWLKFVDKNLVWEPVKQVILTPELQEALHMREVKQYDYWALIKNSLKTGMKGGVFEF